MIWARIRQPADSNVAVSDGLDFENSHPIRGPVMPKKKANNVRIKFGFIKTSK
jgi:hypothetical protein